MGYDYGKIWVAGAAGRVGTMIHNMLDMRDVELLETDVEELDITCAADVNLFGSRNRPNTIINCAGMTDVQECEDNIEQAYKVNALGARNLSAIARKIDARIIQISTDDIFWDNSCRSFHEFDTPNPRTVYGKSKLAGENFVKELAPKHLIIRSSWVYGKEGHNFVNSIIEQVQHGGIIEAAINEYACPTSARELCKVILRLIKEEQEGIYHAVCSGSCSRYELAQEILRIMGRQDVKLEPVELEEPGQETCRYTENCGSTYIQSASSNSCTSGGSAENCGIRYTQRAPRNACPAGGSAENCGIRYTILDNMMLRMCGIEEPGPWQAALKEYLQELNLQEGAEI
ncbi:MULTISPECIES: SDR family oxidoreductase [Clostridia]|uniref:SDR family oxidoreductase n=1 Tax=Clostridia TaxID=186801 RepID=UPI00067EE347|nr:MULTISPECIES: SDR family oxidoreductase [Clostridia]